MPHVALKPVPPEAAPILANLLELYIHDLSQCFGVRIGPDGRFGYPPLQRYFEERERHFPFFILADAELAGFALVTRGSPATSDPSHLDVMEFFVLRALRGSSIGAKAAHLLWDELRGHWVVRVATNNAPALPFWRNTVASYAEDRYAERMLVLRDIERHVFEFDSRNMERPD